MENSDVVGKILITREQIDKRAEELGSEISKDFKGEELIVVGTLKGAVMWMCDILKNLTVDTKIDFVIASSYGSGKKSSGNIKMVKDIDIDIYNQNVLVIEDIVDSGTTLKNLVTTFRSRNPKSLKVCTMLDKPTGRLVDFNADYIGFEVENLFIVGYGLDYDQKYRNLPYVSYLE